MAAIVSTRILRLQAVSPRVAAVNVQSGIMVDTPNIQDGAITFSVTGIDAGPVIASQIAGGGVDIIPVTITTSGFPVQLDAYFELYGGGLLGGGVTKISYGYKIGSSFISGTTGGTVNYPDGYFAVSTGSEQDTPAAGVHTYYLWAADLTASSSTDLYNIRFMAREIKK